MNRALAILVGLAAVTAFSVTACDPGPRCLHYDTQTSWVYAIGPKGTITPHLVVTSVCTQYAQPRATDGTH